MWLGLLAEYGGSPAAITGLLIALGYACILTPATTKAEGSPR